MLSTLFRSVAEEAGYTPTAGQMHYGQALLYSSLFPLTQHCFYVHNKEILPTNLTTPDQAGLLLVINDLFLRQAHRFGSKAEREELKKNINRAANKGLKRGTFLKQAATILSQHCPDALKDLKIGLVGMDDPTYLKNIFLEDSAILSGRASDLLGLFAGTQIFNRDNRLVLSGCASNEALDYIVSGNVLNDPDTANFWNFTFLAAAKLLKKGGSAIHLTSYSNDFSEENIAAPYMHILAGQHRLAALPGKEVGFTFTLFDQVVPCKTTFADIEAFRKQGLINVIRDDGGSFFCFLSPITHKDPKIYAQLDDMIAINYGAKRPAEQSRNTEVALMEINF